jgi:hypothetical protein
MPEGLMGLAHQRNSVSCQQSSGRRSHTKETSRRDPGTAEFADDFRDIAVLS